MTDFDGEHKLPEDFDGCRTAKRTAEYSVYGSWKESTVYERKFRSYRDFVEFITNERPDYVRSSSTANKDLHQHDSWDDALDTVRKGWDHGRQKVLEIVESIDVEGVDMNGQRIEHDHDVMGQRMAMGRYSAGDPECFVTRERVADRTSSGNKSVEIKCNCSASASISLDEFLRRGAAVAALTEVLEWVGISVELSAVKTTDLNGLAVSYEVPIKRPEQPLNPDTLAFQLGNPDMLRRFFWGAEERDISEVRSNLYGNPSSLKRYHDDEDILFIGELDSYTDSFDSANDVEEWVVDKIEKQGIELDS